MTSIEYGSAKGRPIVVKNQSSFSPLYSSQKKYHIFKTYLNYCCAAQKKNVILLRLTPCGAH